MLQSDYVELEENAPQGPPPSRLRVVAGTIGSSFFLTSGLAIAKAGPLGGLLGYSLIGSLVFFVILSLGEMATLLPLAGSFHTLASRFVDPALGFAVGWNYWLTYAVMLPTELVACMITLQYWMSTTMALLVGFLILLVLLSVHVYKPEGFADPELYFSLVKVVAIAFFIVGGVIITGIQQKGFSNYTVGDGPFAGGFDGFVSVLLFCFFAFGGTEVAGLAAAESKNPLVAIPHAIESTAIRISMFYCLSVFVIGLLLPYNDPMLNAGGGISMSPFTLVLHKAGLQSATHIMNVVILIATISNCNTSLFVTSTTLCSMASDKRAPKWLGKRVGDVPVVALSLSALVGCLAFTGDIIPLPQVFSFLTNFTGLSVLLTWSSICVVYMRFRKAYRYQGRNMNDLPFRSKFLPFGAYCALAIMACAFVGNALIPLYLGNRTLGQQLTRHLGVLLFIVLFVGYKLVHGTKIVPLDKCSFVLPDQSEQIPLKTNVIQRLKSFVQES
ncbi:amino acid transporter [Gorgonomyces haynaldii]|nr:amino acid transporter [Gorgonomyces haynaldii]